MRYRWQTEVQMVPVGKDLQPVPVLGIPSDRACIGTVRGDLGLDLSMVCVGMGGCLI